MKRVLKITGLDCAGCAAKLERNLGKIAGVRKATVSFVNQKIIVEFDTEEALKKNHKHRQ